MKNIAVFASGNGSNFEAIAQACENKTIKNGNVKVVICDRAKAYVRERAKNHNIPCVYVNALKFETREDYEKHIVSILKEYDIDLIALAGYMKIITNVLLETYPNKIINIHPALLPSFKGAHGILDAFNYGCKVFGVTIHYVSKELDGGKIISQKAFEYYGNNLDELEEKIHETEHVLYPLTINKLLEGE